MKTEITIKGPRVYLYINSYSNPEEKAQAREFIRQYIANIRDVNKRKENEEILRKHAHGESIIDLIEKEITEEV
jgi:CRISPR/Cas system-associated endonuclease Cas1